MKKWILGSVTSAALLVAGSAYGQEAAAGAGGASAQAGPDGASAQAGPASAGVDASGQAGARVDGTASAATGADDGTAGTGNQDRQPLGDRPDLPADQSNQFSQDRFSQDQSGRNANRAALGVSLSTQDQAVVVTNVEQGSPAQQSGLQAGDQIVSFNGTQVSTTQGFIRAVGAAEVNSQSELVIDRNGQQETLQVTLAPWNDVYQSTASAARTPDSQGRDYYSMRPDLEGQPGYLPQQGYGPQGAPQGDQYSQQFGSQQFGDGAMNPCCCQPMQTAPAYAYGGYYHGGYGYSMGGRGGRGNRRCCW